PVWGNMQWAPKGVYLETPGDVARHADQIYLQAGVSHAMPPPNAVQMDEEARRNIVAWVREVRNQ
ncbi:MAG: cysteine desulfurase, partial [Paracoccaceae bacterium]